MYENTSEDIIANTSHNCATTGRASHSRYASWTNPLLLLFYYHASTAVLHFENSDNWKRISPALFPAIHCQHTAKSSTTQIKASRTNSNIVSWSGAEFVSVKEWRQSLENVNRKFLCKHETECNNITYLYCIGIRWKDIQRRELWCQKINTIRVFHYLFCTYHKEYLSIGAWRLQNGRCK